MLLQDVGNPMELLYFFESIRNPVLDFLMSALTYLGHEVIFLALALCLFWCMDKRAGYYVIAVGLAGTICNQFLKMVFRIPRPWVIDPNFTIVENARAAATGYSFPSGHTQCGVGAWGCLARFTKNNPLRIVAIVIACLIPITRMYLGVHTPLDVAVSFVLATLMVFSFYPMVKKADAMPKLLGFLFGGVALLALGNFLYINLYQFPADVDVSNYSSALKNGATLLGAALGLIHVWYVDTKYLRFETKAVWWAQILKAVIGIALVLLVKSALKPPINALFSLLIGAETYAGDVLRYYLVVVCAGILWPMTFPFFARLGTKKNS